MKYLAAILLLMFAVTVNGQESQDKPMPDRWRGLILDESTPDDAISKLGKPKEDKEGSVRTYPLNKRLTIDHNTKGLRKLSYEKLEGTDKVNLIFKDNKLVLIEIDLSKKIEATTFPNIYDIEFVPKVSQMDTAFKPRDFERDQGKIYPKNYPSYYYLLAMTDKCYVSAGVSNSSMGSLLLGSSRGQAGADDKGGFPGKVERIQLISRTLENRAGADVLK